MGESHEGTEKSTKRNWFVWVAPPLLTLAFLLMYVVFFSRGGAPMSALPPTGVPAIYRSSQPSGSSRELVTGGYVLPQHGPTYNWHTEYAIATKLLIVRAVHFDPRPRNGHSNASVFLVEVANELVKQNLLVECQVGSHVTSSLAVRVLSEGALTHSPALVDCYDLPVDSCSQRAFLYFKTSPDDKTIYTAESEKRFNPPSQPAKNGTASIVACLATLSGNNPPVSQDHLFYEWVRHFKTIGVDHVHMISENSFLNRGGFVNPYIYEASMDKYLSVNIWTQWLNETDIRDFSKVLGYNDCIYRYLGVYQYALIVDWNTFYIPSYSNSGGRLAPCQSSGCHFSTILQSTKCSLPYTDIKKMSKRSQKGEGDSGETGLKTVKGKEEPMSVYLHSIAGVLQLGLTEDSEVVEGYDVQEVLSSNAYFTRVTIDPQGAQC